MSWTARMDLNDLRLVRAVAQAGTLRGAGELLGCSHPTVSRRLERLEALAGGPAFLHTAEGWAPTDLGERLLDAALRVGEELDAVARTTTGQGPLAGRIRLTLPDLLLTHLLMPDLAAFAARYPDVELDLLPEHEVLILGRSRPDVALAALPAGVPPDTGSAATRVGQLAEAVYGRPGPTEHRLGRRDRDAVVPSELAARPARHALDPPLFRWSAARGGLGPALLPCFVGEADPDLMRLPDSPPRVTTDLWLLENPALRRTRRVQAIASWLAGALARAAPRLVGAGTGDGSGENLR